MNVIQLFVLIKTKNPSQKQPVKPNRGGSDQTHWCVVAACDWVCECVGAFKTGQMGPSRLILNIFYSYLSPYLCISNVLKRCCVLASWWVWQTTGNSVKFDLSLQLLPLWHLSLYVAVKTVSSQHIDWIKQPAPHCLCSVFSLFVNCKQHCWKFI